MSTSLVAGAAAVDIQQIGLDYCARHGMTGYPIVPEWPHQMRCLVLAQADRLVAIFNPDWGRWFRLIEETREVVATAVPEREVTVLCFPTFANYNRDFEGFHWGAVDLKNRRYDPVLRTQLLTAIRDVFDQAWASARPATISIGQGACRSISTNCYWGEGHTDPTVHVLRIADPEQQLIAVLVNFACLGDDRVYALSGGLAGATAAVVQQVCGAVPVFHLNTACADHFPAFAEPPFEVLRASAQGYQHALAPSQTREYARMGRVLGGEVCKVLAELEVAGQPLLAQNERWRYTSWSRRAPGLVLGEPLLRVHALPVSLAPVPLPPVEDCTARIRELEAQMRPLAKQMPSPPRVHAYVLDPRDTSSPLFRLMELGSARAYWGIAAGRAKWERRYHPTPPRRGEVALLALNCEVTVVGIPGLTCASTVAPIKEQSPFPTTLVWDALGPLPLGNIVPAAEGALGGVHRGGRDYKQEDIDAMVASIVEGLRTLHHAAST